MKFLSLNT